MANAKSTDDKLVRQYDDGFVVRRMTSEDAQIVIGWYSAICATSSDLSIALDTYGDETKGFVGEINGCVVASVVRVPTTQDISYESLLYVDERYRMCGYGKRMMEAAEKSMVGGILCIDAHEELLKMNHARGFTTGFELTHCTGRVLSNNTESKRQGTGKIQLYSEDMFEALIKYDDQCFIRPESNYRRRLLKRWTSIPGGKTVVALHTTDGLEHVIGYGCRRPADLSPGSHIVGPLYTYFYENALDLINELTKDIVGQTIWMTICVPNKEAVRLVEELKLDASIHMIRMHLNGEPPILNKKVFAVTSIDICGF